jgi:hypothetical protein
MHHLLPRLFPGVDGVIEGMWAADPGGVSDRLVRLTDSRVLDGDPKLVFASCSPHRAQQEQGPVLVLNERTGLRSRCARPEPRPEFHISPVASGKPDAVKLMI